MKIVYIGIAILIIVFVYLFTAQKMGGNREEQFFIRFNTTNINGKLEYAKIGYHGSVFKIEGIEKVFVFYPYTSDLNENNIYWGMHITHVDKCSIFGAYANPKESNRI